MAKTSKKSNGKKNYEDWKKTHNFSTTSGNKGQFEIISKKREEFDAAKEARQNNCFWYTGANFADSSGAGGGDWNKRWEKQEKMYLQWYEEPSDDDFLSNVKAPMTTGRVESTLHKLQRLNIQFAVYPNAEEDIGKSKIAEEVINHLFRSSDFEQSINIWMKDSLIHGSGVARVYFKKVIRDYRFPKDPSEYDEEDEEDLKNKKIKWKEKEKTEVFKGVVIEAVPIQEFYPEPTARSIQGHNYPARYAFRRKIMHIEDFKDMYKNNPNAMNIDKVKPGSDYTTLEDYEFFRPPEDLEAEDVEVLEYENVITDEYIVIANDILVVNTPLPYNHKQLSYIKIDCIKMPHQFYGISVADFLDATQSAYEILMNLAYDHLYRSIETSYMVDSSVFGEFTRQHLRDNSKYIPVNLQPGESLGGKIAPMTPTQIGFDVFRMLDISSQNATLATQIDPSQMALVQGSATATGTMVNKELADAFLNSIVRNFSDGFTQLARQFWAIIKQMYSVPEVKKIVGEDGQEYFEESFMTLRLEGKEIQADEEGYRVDVVDSSDPYYFFEVKGEYLNPTEELDIRVRPESMEMISKGLERQKMMEAFAQLMPLAANPNDPASLQNPLACIDVRKLVQEYIRINGLDSDLLLNKEHDLEKELMDAQMHIQQIFNGMEVPGEPGVSDEHKKYEAKLLQVVNVKAKGIQRQIDDFMENAPPGEFGFDEMGMPLPPEPPKELQEQLDELMDIQERLSMHLQQHNQPAHMVEEMAIADAEEMLAPPAPPAPPMPEGSNVPQVDPGGGQVPMAGGPVMQDVMPGMGAGGPV